MKQASWRTLFVRLAVIAAGLVLALDCLGPARAFAERPPGPNSPEHREVQQLIARLLPSQSDFFVVEFISADAGRDVFEIESRDGRIVLRGNNGVAVAAGLNWYLKYYCNAHFSLKGRQLAVPKNLPALGEQGAAGQPGPLALFSELLLLRVFVGLV